VERRVKPRRIDSITRISLAILSGFFDCPPPANIDRPHPNSRHRCGESYAVRANPILGGLHHEYSLVPAAA
jgi:hypothetical protein